MSGAILYGDVNEDEKVGVGDAVELLRYIVSLHTWMGQL